MSVQEHNFLTRFVAIAILLACPVAGVAQDDRPTVTTLFGPRAIGQPINPGTRSFVGGVSTGPSGNFLGVNRASGWTLHPSTGQPAAAPGPAATILPQTSLQIVPQTEAVTGAQNGVTGSSSGSIAPDVAMPPDVQDAAGAASPTASPVASPRLRYDLGGSQSVAAPAARLADRIQRNPHVKCRSPITVLVRNGITILTGRVATEHDRRVAEMLARLEPGVGRVKNELAIDPPAPSSSTSAPQPR